MYKIDTDAIRNLSNLAKDLTVNGKLTVPGGLEVDGIVKVNKSYFGNDPNGFLELRGGTPYIDLFNAIKYTFGGSGNNFNLPDLRGEFIRGWNNTSSGKDDLEVLVLNKTN